MQGTGRTPTAKVGHALLYGAYILHREAGNKTETGEACGMSHSGVLQREIKRGGIGSVRVGFRKAQPVSRPLDEARGPMQREEKAVQTVRPGVPCTG